MRRLGELIGTRVMSKESARRIGKLDRVVFDAPPRRVVALQVGKSVVDWSSVSGLGTDAVVVESEEHLRPARPGPEERVVGGGLEWKGKRVLSDHGNEIGTITEIELDEASGAIEMVETSTGRLEPDRLLALGSYCLVVSAERASSGASEA